jgi:hypothetical protein
MKKLLAPLAAIALSVVLLVTAALNLESGASNESLSYFIKAVHPDRVLVVEPNLSSFVKANAVASDAGEALLESLEEIAQKYEVTASRLIHVQRNIGSVVPNLLVYVKPAQFQSIEADLVAASE